MTAIAGAFAVCAWLVTRSLWVTAGVFAGVLALLAYHRGLVRLSEEHRDKLAALPAHEAALEAALYRVRRLERHVVALAVLIAAALVAGAAILDRFDTVIGRRFR